MKVTFEERHSERESHAATSAVGSRLEENLRFEERLEFGLDGLEAGVVDGRLAEHDAGESRSHRFGIAVTDGSAIDSRLQQRRDVPFEDAVASVEVVAIGRVVASWWRPGSS